MSKSNLYFYLLSGTLFTAPALAWTSSGSTNIQYTHTYGLELKPASLANSYKTASVCFLGVGDCIPEIKYNTDGNYTLDTESQCLNEGFEKLNCSVVQTGFDLCPYNPDYGKGCKCAPNLTACPAGQAGVGESCGGKYASCRCDSALISCSSKEIGTGASCGGKYQSCTCKPEYFYTSENCTPPRSLSGDSCRGKYTGCSCPDGVSPGSFGCAEYYASPCSMACKKANQDNCQNRTSVSTPYGCMSFYSDCASKCERAYPDNCRNRTAVSTAYGCKNYYSDCQSKCEISGTRPSCNIGDIFYSDYTCNAPEAHISSKKALGIVIYVNANGVGGQIMAPGNFGGRIRWSSHCYDISSLKNKSTVEEALTDFDSCGNTDIIIAQGSSSKYPAAWKARDYAPTSNTKGKWCLPAAGVLYRANINYSKIEKALALLNGTYIHSSSMEDEYYWTSTEGEYNKGTYRAQGFYKWAPQYIQSASKDSSCGAYILGHIKPVMEF